MDFENHWQEVYQSKTSNEVSWYQERPDLSLEFIQKTGLEKSAHLIDVGAGASTLADHLLEIGYEELSLLDISAESLHITRQRLGETAEAIQWLVGDITEIDLAAAHYDIWHDRAVFHFLTEENQVQAYLRQIKASLKLGGYLVIATFADDGPEQCSGLTVARYNEESLQEIFGASFELLSSQREVHKTPWSSEQSFVYCLFKYRDAN